MIHLGGFVVIAALAAAKAISELKDEEPRSLGDRYADDEVKRIVTEHHAEYEAKKRAKKHQKKDGISPETVKDYGEHKDWAGNTVEFVITYKMFKQKFLANHIGNCHDFTDETFLYDEQGSWGLPNTRVGFCCEADCIHYRKWLEERSKRIEEAESAGKEVSTSGNYIAKVRKVKRNCT